jgi:hypothetical protein
MKSLLRKNSKNTLKLSQDFQHTANLITSIIKVNIFFSPHKKKKK